MIPIIEGEIRDPRCVSGGIPFKNLDDLTDGTLKPGNQDLYYGARPEQLDRQVWNALTGHITPTTEDQLPIVPNFFPSAKGSNGTLIVADRSACYDGALGARGMHSLQSFGRDEPLYDNSAYVISSTYHYGLLTMYTNHPVQPSNHGDKPEIYMNELKDWYMPNDVGTLRQGATAFRNARDWASKQRDEAISWANARANDIQAEPPAVDDSFGLVSSFVSEASPDERCSTQAPSQESRTSPDNGSGTAADLQEYETSTDELCSGSRLPAKRSSRYPKGTPYSQRKRRNADESNDGGYSH